MGESITFENNESLVIQCENLQNHENRKKSNDNN